MQFRRVILAALTAVFLALLGGLAGSTAAAGGTVLVTTTADEYDAITANGLCSLREAISAVNLGQAIGGCPAGAAGDTILLTGGQTYALTRTGSDENANVTGDLDVLTAMRLTTNGGQATIDATGLSDRVLDFPGSAVYDASLTALTLYGGSGVALGGGLQVQASVNLTLDQVTLQGNSASQGGGGIFNYNGVLTLTHSNLISNSVVGAGTPAGGGLTNYYLATLIDSSVVGNTSTQDGGGIWTQAALSLRNVTLSGNAAGQNGGGLFADTATASLLLSNVTVVSNTADADTDDDGDGGGLYNIATGLVTKLRNSVLAYNVDLSPGTQHPDCSSSSNLDSQGYNLIANVAGCQLGGTATGNLTGQLPALGALTNYGTGLWAHALLAGSAGVDDGNPGLPGSGGTACELEDVRGYRRLAPCDMGAFESNGLLLVYLPVAAR